MNVLVVTSSFPTHLDDPAGHFVLAEVNELASAGHRVTVFAPGHFLEGPSAFRYVSLGHIDACGWPGILSRLREDPRRASSLVALVRRALRLFAKHGPFDRVIAHWLLPWGLFPNVFAKTELELVAHGTDVQLMLKLPQPVGRWFFRRLKQRQVSLRCVSNSQANSLLATFGAALPALRVKACPISVPLPAELDTTWENSFFPQLAGRMPLIAVVSRLVPGKRVEVALRAATSIPDARVVVVGDGPLANELKQKFPSVIFLGQLTRNRALAVIARADVLLQASRLEGAPTVIREARALGTTVVSTNAGDLLEMSRQDPGLVVLE